MKKNVHIVPHMHWDREWYFTTEESRILLVNNMEEILDMLENNQDYPCYVLDGQTAVLEDYFAVKPEYKERIKKLVQEGKLIIGPWYTQTDEMVVGGESIVRNLLYGIKDCEQFGEHMKIGYLPDSFGQSAQLPQILNGFDIKYSIFWRGVSERHGTDKTEFYWESDNGSKVLVQLFPLGYAIGKYLPTDEVKLKERLDKYFSVLDKGATTDHIILPNGHDQMPIQKNIFEVIEKLKKLYPERNFFLSGYENVFKELEKQDGLSTIKGEFLDGKYMRVHRSIYSTRMDIKAANTRIENKITNMLEPIASIAYSLGFDYHSGLIELIWKEIMKNHAHDSIGCCCSDKVHKEIMSRFFIAEEKVDQLINFYMRKIADAMPCDIALDKLVAYNLLPYEREEVVQAEITTKMKSFRLLDENNNELKFEVVKKEIIDPGLIDRQIVHYGNYDPFVRYTVQFKDIIPAMGYKSYFIKESDSMVESMPQEVNKVETEFYTLSVNENGTIKIYDKNLNKTFDNVLLIEDGADDGDEYDYSPLLDDFIILSDRVKAEYSMKQNKYFAYVDINYRLEVPKDIESRKKKVCDSFIDVKISLRLPMNKPLIDIKIDVENMAKDHRVRAYIPTGLKSKFSISDNQFGSIERAVVDPAMEVWEKEGWDERPDSIYPMLSYVGLSNEEYGVAVLTNSTREYEIVGENYDTIAVTLFRSVGYLGKEEVLRRPGRPSGIKMETPDSQMIGNIKLHFALTTHEKSTLKANVARIAKEFLTPIYTYNKMPYDAMKLNNVDFNVPCSYSLFTQMDKNAVISTVKKSEKNEGLVVRFYNPTDDEKTAVFRFNRELVEVHKTNLNEREIEIINCNNSGEFEVNIKKNEVQTILIR
ncbi:mannosylglycerate hydrolase [Fonticella tunisiensis]|uniref:Mannosylglycerate hydrolase n=1 Tax=Fonticella tunisiensis TaxID=1096341 RepID=A0A4R7KVU8_9CLOT|nr:mannosylglycerate hydrolase [Fonticella tunisiensis]TDT62849.1 mannosylglycerate hydrolase [Fonticella tunisiensis]